MIAFLLVDQEKRDGGRFLPSTETKERLVSVGAVLNPSRGVSQKAASSNTGSSLKKRMICGGPF